MNQLRVLSGSAMIALALSLSCSGDDKGENAADKGTGGSGATGDSGLTCDIVSAEEVSSTLGVSGFEGPTVEDSYGTTTVGCEYKGPDSTYLGINYYPSVSQSTFDHNREAVDENYPDHPAEDATGIGDDAFTQSIPAEWTVNSVFFLKGSTMVGITTTSPVTLDQVKQLAVLVASKL